MSNLKVIIKIHFFPFLLLLVCGLFSFSFTSLLNLKPKLDEFWTRPLISSNKDTAILSPLVLKINNPSLYIKDGAIKEFYKFYPKSFLYGLAILEKVTGSINNAYVVSSILLNLIFWLALYALFFYLAKNGWVSSLLALAATFYTRNAFATASWGLIQPSDVIPRNLFLVLTPLFVLLFLRNIRSSKLPILFFVLGLLANVHSLSAIQFALLLGLVLLVNELKARRLGTLVLSGSAFFIGALPEILDTLSYSTKEAIPAEILKFRLQNFYLPSLTEVRQTGLVMLVPLVVGIVGLALALRKRPPEESPKIVLQLLVSLLIITVVSITLMWRGWFLSFQPLRITVYFYLLGFMGVTYLLAKLWKNSRTLTLTLLSKGLAVFIIVALAFPKYADLPRYWVGTKASILSILNNKPMGGVPPPNKGSIVDTEKMAAIADNSGDNVFATGTQDNITQDNIRSKFKGVWAVNLTLDWGSFDKLCNWAQTNTKVSDSFLVPPDGFALFRTYAQRSLVVNIKDGSQSGFSASYAKSWYQRYLDTKNVYESGTGPELIAIAKKYGAGFIVMADDRLVDLPLVYKNNSFWVYFVKYQ